MVATEVSTQPAAAAAGSPPAAGETQPAPSAGSSGQIAPSPTTPPAASSAPTASPESSATGESSATEASSESRTDAAATAAAQQDAISREAHEKEVARRVQDAVSKSLARAERKWKEQYEAEQRTAREKAEAERAEAERLRLLEEDPLGFADSEKQKIAQAKADAERDRLFAERENAIRRKNWEDHATAFGVDPDDEDVVKAGQTFRDLNALLLKRATDESVLAAAWENPAVQQRHQKIISDLEAKHAAALAKAKEAAHVSGMATLLKSGEAASVDTSPSGGGRAQTFDDIQRMYVENPTPENTKAYAEARKARGWS